MRARNQSAMRLAAGFGSLAILAGAFAPRASAAPGETAVIAQSTMAGIDRFDATLARNGFPGLGDGVARLLGGMGLFSAADLDRKGAFATFIVGGEHVTQQNSTVLAIPLKPGAFPLTRLNAQGAVPVPGHSDSVTLRGTMFRRTAAHMLFGTTEPARIVEPTDAAIDNPVTDPTLLAYASIDMKLARTIAPVAFDRFLDNLGKRADADTPASVDAHAAGVEHGRRAFADLIRGLDQASYSIRTVAAAGDEPEALVMELAASPIAFADDPSGGFARPAFPEGTVARFDGAYPSAKSVPAITSTLAWFEANGRGAARTGADAAKADQMFEAFTKLFVGDATSVAIAPAADGAAGSFAVYVVIQRTAPVPIGPQLDRIEQLSAGEPEANRLTRSKWTQGALDVTRITLNDRAGQPTYAVDFLERGNDLLIALNTSRIDDEAIATLAEAKGDAGGKIDSVAAFDADLPAINELIGQLPDVQLPPEARDLIAKALNNGHVRLTTKADGQTFKVQLSLPVAIVGHALGAVGFVQATTVNTPR